MYKVIFLCNCVVLFDRAREVGVDSFWYKSYNEEDAKKAKEKMEQAVDSSFAYLSENRSEYTKIANDAEKRAWEEA